MENYICKIASLDEVKIREKYLIDTHEKDKMNWIKWRNERIQYYLEGKIILYYGILNNEIICEATASIDTSVDKDSDGLIDEHTAYLSAFRTNKEYEEKGYFSKLYQFMELDLINRGYTLLTLGVEPEEVRNTEIYHHYGYTIKIKSISSVYPNGKVVQVDYYAKKLK